MSKNIIGIDIGGSKIYAARFNKDWMLEKEYRCDTPTTSQEKFLDCLNSVIGTIKDTDTTAIGISFAGLVHSETGLIVKAPNIEILSGFNLKAYIEEEFSLPSTIENDAALMTYAEVHVGVAKDMNPVIGITFGTGIGAGLIIKGEIYSGYQGFSMELGHTFFSMEKDTELEKVFGLNGITDYIKSHTGQEMLGHLHDRFPKWNAETKQIFTPLLDDISKMLYNLSLLFNPEAIVISGGIGQNLFPAFAETLQQKLDTLFLKNRYPTRTILLFSTIKNSGALGAALFAQTHLKS